MPESLVSPPSSGLGRLGPDNPAAPAVRAPAAAAARARLERRRLVLLLASALVVRIVFTVFLFGPIQHATGLSPSSDGYEHVATTIVAGHGYRFNADLGETMFLPPVYPLLLAAIFLVAGPSILATRIVQSLIDTGSCLLVYRLTRRSFGPRAALLAGSLYAVYPGMLVACSRYLTEPLFVFLSLVFVSLLSEFIARGRWRWALLAGAALAAAVLCKSVAGALPVFVLVFALVVPVWRGVRRRMIAGLGLSMVCVMLAAGAWVLRNWVVSGTPVYPATSGGLALYTAHVYAAHPEQRIRDSAHQAAREVDELGRSHGIFLDPRDSYPRWFRSPRDEVRLDRLAREKARAYIVQNPVAFAHHVAGNLWRFWFGAPNPRSIVISVLLNGPLMLLAALALVRHRWWRSPTLMLWLTVCAYLFLSHVAILAVVRYSLTVMPLVCALAAAAVAPHLPDRWFAGARALPAATCRSGGLP